MSKPPKGGSSKVSLKEHLTQVWKTTGKKPAALKEVVAPPDEIMYLWGWYRDMAAGSERLSYSEILSWSQLYHIRLLAIEVDVIKNLDLIYWSALRND